jgi:hypothetical protein
MCSVVTRLYKASAAFLLLAADEASVITGAGLKLLGMGQ